MARSPKNLYLDPAVVKQAEEFARRHDTNVSALVNEFLEAMTRRAEPHDHGPLVKRLRGAAVPTTRGARGERAANMNDYRRHLEKKYGRGRP